MALTTRLTRVVRSGWLMRLERGVFMFPNDTLRRDDSLKFLSRQMPGFHVGGSLVKQHCPPSVEFSLRELAIIQLPR